MTSDNITDTGLAENGPTGTVTDAIVAKVKNVFADPHFTKVPGTMYGFVAWIGGKRYGVVAATQLHRYAGSGQYLLNKGDLDSLVAGLEAGRLNQAYVVSAAADQSGKMTVIDVIEARELSIRLKDVVPFTGKYGEFYRLTAHFTVEEGF
jgi:hypothetical protein